MDFQDHIYLSWKMRVLTDAEVGVAPVVCLYSGAWNEDEIFMLVGAVAALLYTFTAHSAPTEWDVEFLVNNAFGLQRDGAFEIQLTETQAHLGRMLCLIYNGGSARDENGEVKVKFCYNSNRNYKTLLLVVYK